MDKSINHGDDDSSKIVPPADPDQRRLYDRIAQEEARLIASLQSKRVSKNARDYRYFLNYTMDATDDFLRETSRDPFYQRPDHRVSYEPGGWL